MAMRARRRMRECMTTSGSSRALDNATRRGNGRIYLLPYCQLAGGTSLAAGQRPRSTAQVMSQKGAFSKLVGLSCCKTRVRCESGLDKSSFLEAGVALGGNNQVIENSHPQELAGFNELTGNLNVFATGGWVSRRVIVIQDQCRRPS